MKIKELLIPIFLIVLLTQFSCVNHNSTDVLADIKNDTIIIRLSDSTYFSDIRTLYYYNDKIYLTDYKRDQIILLNNNGHYFNSLGRKGRGPGEFLGAYHLFVKNDTIYTANDAKRTIEVYSQQKYIKTLHFPKDIRFNPSYRFFLLNDCLYCSSITDTNSIASWNIMSGMVKHFGRKMSFSTEKQTQIRNKRHLFQDHNNIYAISDNEPIVEKYDTSGKLIEVFDYSSIQIIKDVLSYFDLQNNGENSYYQLVTDSYQRNGRLYILLLSKDTLDKIHSNTILVINTEKPNMEFQQLYQLENSWYSSFCVTDSLIWAFSESSLIKYSL